MKLHRVFRLLDICVLLLAIAAVAAASGHQPEPKTSESPAGIRTVASVGVTVSDLDRSLEFYSGVLGFEKISDNETLGDAVEHLTGVFGARTRTARLRLGEEHIELTQFLAPEGRPIPPDSRSNDRWFQHIAIVVSDMDRAYAHLRLHKVRHASTGPQTLPKALPNASGISAFYFKDADGHVLEVIHFPPGKGDPRWQVPADSSRLFLGIDHTAIAVADTDTSLRFYQGALGMRIAGGSENYGVEQEHLNNVFGARLRITTLKAPGGGPGVELLEYLAPTNGRPYPPDSQANDLWHWQTVLAAPSIDSCAAALRSAHAAWVSPGIVADTASSPTLTVRDPDGHAVVVTTAAAH